MRKLILLFVLLCAGVASGDTKWPDSGGGGAADNLGNHTATQDIILGDDEIISDTYGYNADLSAHTATKGFWTRPVEVGPLTVCQASNTTPDTLDNQACETLTPPSASHADCGGVGTCIRNDGLLGTPGQGLAHIVVGSDSIGPGSQAQDNIFFIRYNAGVEGELSAPDDPGTGATYYNFEMDWSPDGNQLVEFFRQNIRRGGAAGDAWRDFGHFANLDALAAGHNFASGAFTAEDTGVFDKYGIFQVGALNAPIVGARMSTYESTPTSYFEVEGNTNSGGRPLASWSAVADANATPHNVNGVTVDLHATSDTTSAQRALAAAIRVDAPSRFGACDANSTGAGITEGAQCIENKDCNDGDVYTASPLNGICVHGNGTLSNGTSDGLCIATANGAIGTTPTFCDTTFGAIGACDAGHLCTDIQDYWLQYTGTAVGLYVEASSKDITADIETIGWCSSDGGGDPEDEGKTCHRNADCESATCVFDTGGSMHVNDLTGANVKIDISGSRTFGHPFNPIASQQKQFSNVNGMVFDLTWSGTNQEINQSTMLKFGSPSISNTGGLWENESVIRVANQWGNAEYTPSIIQADAFTTRTGAKHAMQFATFGWDQGNWSLGRARIWSEAEGGTPGTVDNLRVIFNNNPWGPAVGQAIALHSESNNHGLMKWGVSDAAGAASFDTGTEVCAVSSQTCVDSDEMGSNGSVTTCSTAHANGLNFWAFCRD